MNQANRNIRHEEFQPIDVINPSSVTEMQSAGAEMLRSVLEAHASGDSEKIAILSDVLGADAVRRYISAQEEMVKTARRNFANEQATVIDINGTSRFQHGVLETNNYGIAGAHASVGVNIGIYNSNQTVSASYGKEETNMDNTETHNSPTGTPAVTDIDPVAAVDDTANSTRTAPMSAAQIDKVIVDSMEKNRSNNTNPFFQEDQVNEEKKIHVIAFIDLIEYVLSEYNRIEQSSNSSDAFKHCLLGLEETLRVHKRIITIAHGYSDNAKSKARGAMSRLITGLGCTNLNALAEKYKKSKQNPSSKAQTDKAARISKIKVRETTELPVDKAVIAPIDDPAVDIDSIVDGATSSALSPEAKTDIRKLIASVDEINRDQYNENVEALIVALPDNVTNQNILELIKLLQLLQKYPKLERDARGASKELNDAIKKLSHDEYPATIVRLRARLTENPEAAFGEDISDGSNGAAKENEIAELSETFQFVANKMKKYRNENSPINPLDVAKANIKLIGSLVESYCKENNSITGNYPTRAELECIHKAMGYMNRMEKLAETWVPFQRLYDAMIEGELAVEKAIQEEEIEMKRKLLEKRRDFIALMRDEPELIAAIMNILDDGDTNDIQTVVDNSGYTTVRDLAFALGNLATEARNDDKKALFLAKLEEIPGDICKFLYALKKRKKQGDDLSDIEKRSGFNAPELISELEDLIEEEFSTRIHNANVHYKNLVQQGTDEQVAYFEVFPYIEDVYSYLNMMDPRGEYINSVNSPYFERLETFMKGFESENVDSETLTELTNKLLYIPAEERIAYGESLQERARGIKALKFKRDLASDEGYIEEIRQKIEGEVSANDSLLLENQTGYTIDKLRELLSPGRKVEAMRLITREIEGYPSYEELVENDDAAGASEQIANEGIYARFKGFLGSLRFGTRRQATAPQGFFGSTTETPNIPVAPAGLMLRDNPVEEVTIDKDLQQTTINTTESLDNVPSIIVDNGIAAESVNNETQVVEAATDLAVVDDTADANFAAVEGNTGSSSNLEDGAVNDDASLDVEDFAVHGLSTKGEVVLAGQLSIAGRIFRRLSANSVSYQRAIRGSQFPNKSLTFGAYILGGTKKSGKFNTIYLSLSTIGMKRHEVLEYNLHGDEQVSELDELKISTVNPILEDYLSEHSDILSKYVDQYYAEEAGDDVNLAIEPVGEQIDVVKETHPATIPMDNHPMYSSLKDTKPVANKGAEIYFDNGSVGYMYSTPKEKCVMWKILDAEGRESDHGMVKEETNIQDIVDANHSEHQTRTDISEVSKKSVLSESNDVGNLSQSAEVNPHREEKADEVVPAISKLKISRTDASENGDNDDGYQEIDSTYLKETISTNGVYTIEKETFERKGKKTTNARYTLVADNYSKASHLQIPEGTRSSAIPSDNYIMRYLKAHYHKDNFDALLDEDNNTFDGEPLTVINDTVLRDKNLAVKLITWNSAKKKIKVKRVSCGTYRHTEELSRFKSHETQINSVRILKRLIKEEISQFEKSFGRLVKNN